MELIPLNSLNRWSTTGSAHLLGLKHNSRKISGNWTAEVLIEEMCNTCNAKRIIPTDNSPHAHKIIKYDRVWLITVDTPDETIFYLKYKDLIELSISVKEFVRMCTLHSLYTPSENHETVMLSVANQCRYKKSEGNF